MIARRSNSLVIGSSTGGPILATRPVGRLLLLLGRLVALRLVDDLVAKLGPDGTTATVSATARSTTTKTYRLCIYISYV